MARWKRGEPDVEALLAAGELQKPTDAAANDERLLEKTTVTLTTARSAVDTDPDSAKAIIAASQGILDQLGLF